MCVDIKILNNFFILNQCKIEYRDIRTHDNSIIVYAKEIYLYQTLTVIMFTTLGVRNIQIVNTLDNGLCSGH